MSSSLQLEPPAGPTEAHPTSAPLLTESQWREVRRGTLRARRNCVPCGKGLASPGGRVGGGPTGGGRMSCVCPPGMGTGYFFPHSPLPLMPAFSFLLGSSCPPDLSLAFPSLQIPQSLPGLQLDCSWPSSPTASAFSLTFEPRRDPAVLLLTAVPSGRLNLAYPVTCVWPGSAPSAKTAW